MVVRNAAPDTYDDDLQLFVQSETIVQPAQTGAGETALSDAGENERLALTDGGTATAESVEQGAGGTDDATATDSPPSGDVTNQDIDDFIIQLTTVNNSGDGATRDAVAADVAAQLGVDDDLTGWLQRS